MSEFAGTVYSASFVSQWFASTRRSGVAVASGWALALALHVAGGLWIGQRPSAALERTPPPVDLEFVNPPPAPPMPEPEKELEPPKAEAVAAAPVVPRAAAPAARAGALHTAAPDAPAQQSDEPVDFTTDPTGTSYGSGVVAVGGTAAVGLAGARASGPAKVSAGTSVAPAGPALTALSDLSRRPALPRADPCRGYFPGRARDDAGEVALMVVVGRSGRASQATLLAESPRDQGFFAAARTCLMSERFTPALDRAGNPAATAIRVNVSFRR